MRPDLSRQDASAVAQLSFEEVVRDRKVLLPRGGEVVREFADLSVLKTYSELPVRPVCVADQPLRHLLPGVAMVKATDTRQSDDSCVR